MPTRSSNARKKEVVKIRPQKIHAASSWTLQLLYRRHSKVRDLSARARASLIVYDTPWQQRGLQARATLFLPDPKSVKIFIGASGKLQFMQNKRAGPNPVLRRPPRRGPTPPRAPQHPPRSRNRPAGSRAHKHTAQPTRSPKPRRPDTRKTPPPRAGQETASGAAEKTWPPTT